jgi:ribonuclease HII
MSASRNTHPEIRLGVDENGLGPRLGPLLVTAVTARTTGEGHRQAEGRPKGAMRARLGDSKALVSHGNTTLGEAWARVLAKRMGLVDFETPDALVKAFSLDPEESLRAPCPDAHAGQCWNTGEETFSAEAKLLARIERDLEKLAGQGIDVVRVRCVVVCTRRLNQGVDRGLTRFHLDLHAMERLILDAREHAGAEVIALCGKVGGFDRYADAFGPLNGRLHAAMSEGRRRSEYSLPGVGRIAFVRDADENHLLVCMASLVGKWARDLLMARIVRYHRAANPDLPDASGYHDPVTARFVEATSLSRKRMAVPDDCFERRALFGSESDPDSAV